METTRASSRLRQSVCPMRQPPAPLLNRWRQRRPAGRRNLSAHNRRGPRSPAALRYALLRQVLNGEDQRVSRPDAPRHISMVIIDLQSGHTGAVNMFGVTRVGSHLLYRLVSRAVFACNDEPGTTTDASHQRGHTYRVTRVFHEHGRWRCTAGSRRAARYRWR